MNGLTAEMVDKFFLYILLGVPIWWVVGVLVVVLKIRGTMNLREYSLEDFVDRKGNQIVREAWFWPWYVIVWVGKSIGEVLDWIRDVMENIGR